MSNTFANREVCDLIFEDYKTKKVFLNMDYANVSTTEITGESVFAYGGKGHPKRVAFSGERGGTLTIETQMQSFKLYQLLTGGDVDSSAKFITREEFTVGENGKIQLPDTYTIGSDVTVFAANDDCGTPKKITIEGKDVKVADAKSGDIVIVYYVKAIENGVQKISVKGSSFPKAFTVYGDTVMKTEDDSLLPYKFIAYKAIPQSNMSISMSNNGDPATITITCDLMVNENDDMLDLILEDENNSTTAGDTSVDNTTTGD
ncbi:MAG: hypothetical protein HDT39_14555 [Lachnospiraceae bacterium]|nr:hypothetical protein [Lachnospiraceae bacterium]